MTDPDDRTFLEDCRRGSPQARERFVRRYARLVQWSIRKTLEENGGRGESVDDVFQEVFGRLLEPTALRRLRDPAAVNRWIIVSSCRAALDAVRARRRRERRETPLEQLAPETESGPEAPAEPLLDDEKLRLVLDLVDRLPARERACVRYHYAEGLTYARIGEVLGLPASTVATVIRRACDTLRVRLEQRGYEKS